mmetsp:Transcript_29720/g.74684  ORF Transcript_29720/g.74684 Transcript_29720/m.74684 type:complete len:305 (-) Transcript_29720:38-952(-)
MPGLETSKVSDVASMPQAGSAQDEQRREEKKKKKSKKAPKGSMSGALGQAWAESGEEEAAPADGEAAQQEPEDPRLPHERLLQDEAASPLELAALARLRAWEGDREAITVEELMKTARWLSAKLDATPRPTPNPLQNWKGRRRVYLVSVVAGLFFAVLAVVGLIDALTIEGFKVAAVTSAGLVTTEGHGGVGRRPAAVASAVHYHSIFEYPELPLEDLRRAQDIVIRTSSAFHYFRVASVSQLVGGAVLVTAEDGTLIRVTVDRVTLEQPFMETKTLLPDDVQAGSDPALLGAFRVLIPRVASP